MDKEDLIINAQYIQLKLAKIIASIIGFYGTYKILSHYWPIYIELGKPFFQNYVSIFVVIGMIPAAVAAVIGIDIFNPELSRRVMKVAGKIVFWAISLAGALLIGYILYKKYIKGSPLPIEWWQLLIFVILYLLIIIRKRKDKEA